MMLPAHFAGCPRCGRLLTVDSLNPRGRCTAECGGIVDDRPLSCWCGDEACVWVSRRPLGWGDIIPYSRHIAPFLRAPADADA